MFHVALSLFSQSFSLAIITLQKDPCRFHCGMNRRIEKKICKTPCKSDLKH